MKSTTRFFKRVAFFFAALILFQGCAVYTGNVTLEQAVQNGSKVKVKTQNKQFKQSFYFDRIEKEDGNYYGFLKTVKVNEKTLLDKTQITNVAEKNKSLSTLLPILAVVVLLGILTSSIFRIHG